MIELRILSWEDYPGLSRPSVITRVLIREGQKVRVRSRKYGYRDRGWSDLTVNKKP